MIITKSNFVENTQYYLDMLKETEASSITIADEKDNVTYRLSITKEID